MHKPVENVVKKIKDLPPDRLAEVEDFIDFVSRRTADESLTTTVLALGKPRLEQIWNNDDDAVYDEL